METFFSLNPEATLQPKIHKIDAGKQHIIRAHNPQIRPIIHRRRNPPTMRRTNAGKSRPRHPRLERHKGRRQTENPGSTRGNKPAIPEILIRDDAKFLVSIIAAKRL